MTAAAGEAEAHQRDHWQAQHTGSENSWHRESLLAAIEKEGPNHSNMLCGAMALRVSYAKLCCYETIPFAYHFGMSKQIAVRLPDDIVDFIDRVVSDGEASSRAVVVSRALDRERRRQVAARDAAILAQVEPDPEMQELAEYAARTPIDDLD